MANHVKYFGADYYPEHWPEERWPEDARLMQEAGFNVVRMAEFAWTKMEPSEGRFDFDWLHKAIDILHNRGISTVLGTPTAAAPAWLMQAHPEIYRVDENKRRASFGTRQFMCPNAPAFREGSRRIVAAMAKELGSHEAVIGWQTDNEFGPLCYCETCRSAFHEWLQAKYGTLDALNDAWGTVFWSQTYSDWDQIPLPWAMMPPPNPGLYLDYRRFMTDSYVSFQKEQVRILREHSPRRFITHNFMGFNPDVLDYHKLADDLDFVSWDNYPQVWAAEDPDLPALGHDFTRGMKRRGFWVMEEQSGPGGWGSMGAAPKPGQIGEWTRKAIAHGAEGIVYFRWRPARFGIEQYWHGVLNHDGSTGRRYEEIKRVGEEIRSGEVPAPPPTQSSVALLLDGDSRFAFQLQPCNPQFSYFAHILHYYRVLRGLFPSIDVLPAGADLSGYEVVVVPTLYVLRSEVAARLADFVRAGGTLVTTFRSGVKDEFSRIVDEPFPGLLREVCGVEVEEYHSPLPEETNWLRGTRIDMPSEPSAASIWLDVLRPTTAEVIAEYITGFGSGEPAVTVNKFGKGSAIYIGTWAERAIVSACLQLGSPMM